MLKPPRYIYMYVVSLASLVQRVQTVFATFPIPYPINIVSLCSGAKWPECKLNNLPT